MNVCEAVAKRINNLLKEKHMKLYGLEKNSTIAHGTMMRIVHGKNKNITLKIVMQIAAGFQMTLLEFLNDEIFVNNDIEIY